MELRQWLFVAGALIILFVVADALRRARRARHDALEMARQMGGADIQQSPLDDDFNPELPAGGFRVVRERADGDKVDAGVAPPPSSATAEAEGLVAKQGANGARSASWPGPSKGPLSPPTGATAKETVKGGAPGRTQTEPFVEPVLRADPADSVSWHPRDVPPATQDLRAEGFAEDLVETPAEGLAEGPGGDSETRGYRTVARPPASTGRNGQAVLDEDFKSRFLKRITPIQAAKQKKVEDKTPASGSRKEEIIVVNVISKSEEGFKGYQLLDLVEACGMEMGRRLIFHRHEHGLSEGPVQFSMANAVEPGTFGEGFEDTLIPGVSFFLQLPGPDDSMKAFEYMVETAQCLARNLGGELRDERQSVMTGQTIEHGRQRVREFERRQLSVRG